MNYLVDTHALLWMMFEPKKLSQKSQEILADKSLYKFVSIASLWEIAIKKPHRKIATTNRNNRHNFQGEYAWNWPYQRRSTAH